MPECSRVPKSYSLLFVALLNSIPTYLLNFDHSYNYSYNDDIQPSTVVSNQLPSGLVLVILIIATRVNFLNTQLQLHSYPYYRIYTSSGSAFSYDTHTYTTS